MQANEAPQERLSAAWRQDKRDCEPRRGSVMVKTIDATTTDRLRRSPLYSDLSPSCARKRACMELTTICRFQRLLNPSFRLFQCFRSFASLPCKIVREIDTTLFKKSFYHQGFFAVKRRAVFVLGAMWRALAGEGGSGIVWLAAWKRVSNDAKRTVTPPNANHSTLHQGCFLCVCFRLHSVYAKFPLIR